MNCRKIAKINANSLFDGQGIVAGEARRYPLGNVSHCSLLHSGSLFYGSKEKNSRRRKMKGVKSNGKKKIGSYILFILLIIVAPQLCYPYPLNIALDDLANQIITEIDKSDKQIVAIADFYDLSGRITEFGLFISEELVNRLGRSKKINLVERRDLKRVMEELQLHLSGIVDTKSAKEVGALLGAEILCTGTVIELPKSFKINARLIDTETGRIFATAGATVDKSEDMGMLKRDDFGTRLPGGKVSAKYPRGNLLANGGFQQGYSDWKRQIGDITKGSSQTEIISFPNGRSGKALHIRHKGEGYFQFSQIVFVPGPDLIFSASFQASSKEGMIIGFSGTGVVQIGLQYFDENGSKVGETVLVNYVKNPFADTPLIGVPRRNPDTYKTHYIEFSKDRFHQEYRIDIRQEIENNLLGIEPDGVRQIAVVLWCGATHPQAGTELWITDVSLKAK
jgi:TolB-like protein